MSAYYTPEAFLSKIGPGCAKFGNLEVYHSPFAASCDGKGSWGCDTNSGPNWSAIVSIYRKTSGIASIGDLEEILDLAPASAPSASPSPASSATMAYPRMVLLAMVCAVVSVLLVSF